MKKIMVLGSDGQLGKSIQTLSSRYSGIEFQFVTIQELDLSDIDSIQGFINQSSCDYIVNCAAYTAVDKAETDFETADKINHLAVGELAKIAKQLDIGFIHISTDYVFDGSNSLPYVESDSVSPQCVYGQTKLAGERAFLETNVRGLIIRTSWVYSEFGNNFVKTMLRLGQEKDSLSVIYDQVGTPTYATDLAKVILDIITDKTPINFDETDMSVFHFSNEGVCSWFDFAKTIFELTSIDCKVNPIETFEYPTPAKRPHYSVLNKTKIKSGLNLSIPYWKDSLKTCLKELQYR